MDLFKMCVAFTVLLLIINPGWAAVSVDDKSKVISAASQLPDGKNAKLEKIEKEGVDYFVYEGSATHRDIQEQDPKLRSIIEKAGKEAEKSVAKGYGGQLPDLGGVCGLIWAQQKRILKEKYNIEWKTPQEMNPDTRFD